jgi:hypothetical protein
MVQILPGERVKHWVMGRSQWLFFFTIVQMLEIFCHLNEADAEIEEKSKFVVVVCFVNRFQVCLVSLTIIFRVCFTMLDVHFFLKMYC